MVQNDQNFFTIFTYVLVNDTQILHKNDDNKWRYDVAKVSLYTTFTKSTVSFGYV